MKHLNIDSGIREEPSDVMQILQDIVPLSASEMLEIYR